MPYLKGLDGERTKQKKPLAVCSQALDGLRIFRGSHSASFLLLDQAEHGSDSGHSNVSCRYKVVRQYLLTECI